MNYFPELSWRHLEIYFWRPYKNTFCIIAFLVSVPNLILNRSHRLKFSEWLWLNLVKHCVMLTKFFHVNKFNYFSTMCQNYFCKSNILKAFILKTDSLFNSVYVKEFKSLYWIYIRIKWEVVGIHIKYNFFRTLEKLVRDSINLLMSGGNEKVTHT